MVSSFFLRKCGGVYLDRASSFVTRLFSDDGCV